MLEKDYQFILDFRQVDFEKIKTEFELSANYLNYFGKRTNHLDAK